MAEWTFTAANLEGEECGHDHRSLDSVRRCLPALGPTAVILARNAADRQMGRPCLNPVRPDGEPRRWQCPDKLPPDPPALYTIEAADAGGWRKQSDMPDHHRAVMEARAVHASGSKRAVRVRHKGAIFMHITTAGRELFPALETEGVST